LSQEVCFIIWSSTPAEYCTGTAGLGKETILALAAHNPQRIYFSGRDSKRAEAIIAEANNAASLVFIQCDLTSLASVEKAAKQIALESDRLDTVICNAGVMNVPPALTKDGYEVHFGINHVGHALLLKILLPLILRTAEMPGSDVRIVSLTSQGFTTHPSDGIIFKDLRTTQDTMFVRPTRYGQSKLANLLYAAELARRYPQITSVSVHPGVVSTDLLQTQTAFMKALIRITNPFVLTPAEGARNQLWAATAVKSGITNGEYYEPVGELGKHARKSKDTKLAAELWEWTEKELAGYHA
jgi:NAD(P)-dependent dehydrogenase (short-subunit alcohol dehydrogenase family)